MSQLDEAGEKPMPSRRPDGDRIKMTIEEQATFLRQFCGRFRMRDGSRADKVDLHLSTDEMKRFETIEQTMLIMEMHGADKLIRDKISRGRAMSSRSGQK